MFSRSRQVCRRKSFNSRSRQVSLELARFFLGLGAGGWEFWIIGTRSRNTIRCSKIHVHCHFSFCGRPEKPVGSADGMFQKSSNSRLMGKVPKIHCSWHAPRAVARARIRDDFTTESENRQAHQGRQVFLRVKSRGLRVEGFGSVAQWF
jgi:hypothetical protein